MLHIDLHNEETGTTIRVGTLGEFSQKLRTTMKDVRWKSRIFSRTGTADPAEIEAAIMTAVDQVFQEIIDARR